MSLSAFGLVWSMQSTLREEEEEEEEEEETKTKQMSPTYVLLGNLTSVEEA